MAKIYNIYFKKLGRWLLPIVLRNGIIELFLQAATSPLTKLNTDFQLYRNAILYNLSINYQKPYLTMGLNDKYDTTIRGIYLKNPVRQILTFVFRKAESKPLYLYRKSENIFTYLFTKAETGRIGVDFIVYVPLHVKFDNAEMVAFIYKYCLPSKRFKIVVY